MIERDKLAASRHWVIKIGSGVIVRDARFIDRPTFSGLVEGIHHLIDAGHRVTVVSSGAVALGRRTLPSATGRDLPELQALAALGQAQLIRMWDEELRHYGHRAAQVLFGRADLDRREGFLNARLAIDAIHRLGVVPVINENDTIATEGLRFDDNDQLAGMASGLVQADLLVILSDVDGVYDLDEERRFANRLSSIQADDGLLDEIAGPSVSGVGRGGMISKVAAARAACRLGVPCVIAPGKRHHVLQAIQRGDDVGTLITPTQTAIQGRKVWLGAGALSTGRVHCDAGAVDALLHRGASLLPKGVTKLEGEWPEGAVVDLVGPSGHVFARGLSVYASADVEKLRGRHSDDIDQILGFRSLDAVIHRDSLVIL
ncbi:MAG: glutamate 5-kinase [bacterium]